MSIFVKVFIFFINLKNLIFIFVIIIQFNIIISIKNKYFNYDIYILIK